MLILLHNLYLLLTWNKSVRGLANSSRTNLISVQSSWDLNSKRYRLKMEWAVCRTPLITWKSPIQGRENSWKFFFCIQDLSKNDDKVFIAHNYLTTTIIVFGVSEFSGLDWLTIMETHSKYVHQHPLSFEVEVGNHTQMQLRFLQWH
jgi:hypothetical protein